MDKKSMFWEVTPNSWGETKLLGRSDALMNYVFRGQASNKWQLKTSIERTSEQYQGSLLSAAHHESVIIDIFKSRAHHYIQAPPDDNKVFEWLAMVQDFGGPTRLLDFTESFYIASFFAVEKTTEDACVWCIEDFDIKFKTEYKGDVNYGLPYSVEKKEFVSNLAEIIILDQRKSQETILVVRPIRLNERMAVQKGLFVFPCSIDKSFESNLCSAFQFPFNTLDSKNATLVTYEDVKERLKNWSYLEAPSILKINLKKEWHREILTDLYHMNIDAASLFPGLDGFTRSLSFVVQSGEYTPFELGGRR